MAKTSFKAPGATSALARQQAMAAAAPAGNPQQVGPHDLLPTSSKYSDQSYKLGPSTCKRKTIAAVVEGRIIPGVNVHKPGKEGIPSPRPGEVVVFEAFFEAGLGLSAVDFLSEVLDLFHVTLPQLYPNAIARLAIFEWALRAKGCEGRAEIFAALHKASCQPKTYQGFGGENIVLAFGSINFRLRDQFQL
ncbi:hypothetical protein GUJ93_ZPchr0013g34648 [Zizania palustris]|uniref:Transposase (putative) gypsy type domain-containing protein n=1 Tax=Zizania palustris TaxID=103762 RepID=A0A8J6BZY7_ZIZPA|nr:hypothetical protein GUJ93_ZPchr0013g34648 [Zizania palustris]